MNLEEQLAHHRRMAESYRNAYLRQGVQDGEKYEAWKFAEEATYASPYFMRDQTIKLNAVAADSAKAATMEAKAYSLTFPDWKPANFQHWASDYGFVMKTRWQGTTRNGITMGFYSYSFVETNAKGEVTHWETHVNDEYSPFLDVAIGVHGPFNGNEYMEALHRCLTKAGVAV